MIRRFAHEDDPIEGSTYAELRAGEPVVLEVSCTRKGRIINYANSTDMEWAKIIGGRYSTLWAPMPFVRGQAIGQSRTLLPCSSWRWILQNPLG
jgi:hypothetical protein